MSELKCEGILKLVKDAEQVNATFQKREFVIETEEQYPQSIKFELHQMKCPDIDNHKIGSRVTVHFNLRGRAWTNPKNETIYFNTLVAWRIEGDGNVQQNTTNNTVNNSQPDNDKQEPTFADDLPF